MKHGIQIFIIGVLVVSGALSAFAEKLVIRVGHFPNITHAQGLIAHQLTRQGNGWFEQRLGENVEIQWYVYNAGPSAMEAIFAGALDVTYVGPNPSINAYVKSQGEEIRIIAGAANGGAALVVQGDGRITTPEDFRDRKIATPQLGNTQDVACRAWLMEQGYNITQLGGDVLIIPTANPDQLNLFIRGDIDGAWTVEPWVSRLEIEGNGKIYLEETDSITTVLVSSVGFLNERRELVKKFVAAHAELTEWIAQHPEEAQQLIRAELKAETTREMSAELVSHAWPRLHFTTRVNAASLEKFIGAAKKVGFLRGDVDFSKFVVQP